MGVTIILRRLVAALVVLNALVLAMLLAVELTADEDAEAVVAVDRTDEPARVQSAADRGDAAVSIEEVAEPPVDPAAPAAVPPQGPSDVDESPAGEPGSGLDPPPVPELFVAAGNEVQPEAKEMGAMVVHRLTNYEVGSSLTEVLATLPVVDPAHGESTASEAARVHHPEMWSRGTVEYVQNGGHLDGRISLIIVVRQELGIEGEPEPVHTETRTMEVRLAEVDSGAWTLETVASTGGSPISRPDDLSALAAAVVDHDRIDLPDTGVWDIYAGDVNPGLLAMMLDLAEQTPYSVVVFGTGHAYNVFGTDRVSNHSVGQAVDIYKLGPERVIDAHDPTSGTYAVSEWVVSRTDIKEFGSPWRFTDAVAHAFTNEVHHDHLHIGVYPAPNGSP